MIKKLGTEAHTWGVAIAPRKDATMCGAKGTYHKGAKSFLGKTMDWYPDCFPL
ncbi:MAG: hypothetical protein ABI691_13325 [Ginsengibacter sp.]